MSDLILKVGKDHTIGNVMEWLLANGYEKVIPGEILPGQFSLSGGTIQIFPTDQPCLLTIDYFGNEIDRMFFREGVDKILCSEAKILPNILLLNDGTKVRRDDYFVHEDHGIGIFSNLQVKNVQGNNILYAVITYLNNDVLYLPLTLKDKLSPYIGVGRRHPRLSKLGSQAWAKTYKKTYENVRLMAKELLEIYAKRELVKKIPWQINSDWDQIVREDFRYIETEDQIKAIDDIFRDFKRDLPMDRLICGDVGLGKTEVAIRAITQTIFNGYQVALLVPTTILAEQHYATMSSRFKNLPIKIGKLSRLATISEQKEVVDNLKHGSVDLLIGTHRLLENDVVFKNIGLLIIDEEQKFGVRDKEKLKKIKESISVLTITATPIPRTLFMALSGLRDVSQINSIPKGRMPVKTEILKYDRKIIISKIKKELDREGQIYYLHNEVRTITGVKSWLEKEFPDVRITIAHGQMHEESLGKIMAEFAKGETKILVCSTIIENGLDLSNVNTLIVDDSHKFGLAQMHQIRGRIGRSKRQAFAIFTYPEKKLTENSLKRFKSLATYTEIGSGYNIALSDLEIRGGGNVLGKEQHGSMEAVGLVLYTKLLKLAVEKLKAESI